MSTTALKAISITMGICFVLFGTMKLGPLFSEDFYRSVRKTFIKTYSSFPVLKEFGWSPSPHSVRRFFGATEVIAGVMLILCSGLLKDIGAGILLSLMVFNLVGIWNANGDPKDASNSIVFALLLTCYFVIRIQILEPADDSSTDEAHRLLKEDLRRRVGFLRSGLIKLNHHSTNANTHDDHSTEQIQHRVQRKLSAK